MAAWMEDLAPAGPDEWHGGHHGRPHPAYQGSTSRRGRGAAHAVQPEPATAAERRRQPEGSVCPTRPGQRFSAPEQSPKWTDKPLS